MAGRETVADGRAVVVTDHVVREGHVTLPGEACRAGRRRIQWLILESAVGPVSVRGEHGRYFASHILRAVEIARDVKTGVALEIDLLDGVIAAIDLAEDRGLDRRLRRSGPQSGADQDLFLQPRRAIGPVFLAAITGEVVDHVEVSDFSQSEVGFREFLRE